ncbi:MAG: aspartyl/asparaginyl beta-hydroxylase domain-containing protein [Pseudomonadota bacterium]
MDAATLITPITAPDRIKLPIRFDAEALQAEAREMKLRPFTYYDVTMIAGPPDMSKHHGASRTPSIDYGDNSDIPVIQGVVETFRQHTDVTLARILRLQPGAEVKEHTDPTLGLDVANSVVRLTVPITDPTGVTFWLNDEPMDMQPGECWYMKLNDPHRILNESEHDRTNLTLDVVPNAWVMEMLGL